MSKPTAKGRPGIARRGMLLVLSSPSGAGKTTLARRLLAADAGIRMSVSVTTRRPRRGEVEGTDYFFVGKAEFDRLKRARKLLEWAEVFGESYGTPRAQVMELVEGGTDVLFDIDWQGARSLKKRLPHDVVRVFSRCSSAAIVGGRMKTLTRSARALCASCCVPCQSMSNRISWPPLRTRCTWERGVP